MITSSYIERKLSHDLFEWLHSEEHPNIALISGVVGCGKTTLVTHFLKAPDTQEVREIFTFTLDDVILRHDIAADSHFFVSYVKARSRSQKKILCFVDEVQKSEAVFDAIKIAWDQGIDFIVSGSNPEYLETQASLRLQRRSTIFDTKPLSLVEILHHRKLLSPEFSLAKNEDMFFSVLDGTFASKDLEHYIEAMDWPPLSQILEVCAGYWTRGGLPKAFLAKSAIQAFSHIQASVERGFAPILQDTMDIFDMVTVELAHGSSCEFSYENFFQRIRSKSRDRVNHVISKLAAHGYIKAKRPFIPEGKSSYFVTYSMIDPGMIAYLTDTTEPTPEWQGRVIESYIHARLDQVLSLRPRKSTLAYFKPYTIREAGAKDELRFKPGEIDFVVYFGALSSRKACGLEVKRTPDLNSDSFRLLEDLVRKKTFKFGVILYAGMPRLEMDKGLLFWPWWLV